ncbi:MAG: calcium-translocating P-type ATPase, PMCA-type [Halothermotrichaceae bacterium]
MLSQKEYYLLTQNELMDYFNVFPESGLSDRDVRKRLYQYGFNKIASTNNNSILTIFFNQFKDFMIIVLTAAASLSLIMGEIADAVTIIAIVVLNGIMGFVQEYRAEQSLAALKKLAAPTAKVIRNNKIEEVEAEELVPGDILLLETGNKVPADLRIISSKSLQADESLLTGESVPVNKSERQLYARGIDISEQTNMLFMGTTITRGRARALIVSTGMDTEMGKIADLLESSSETLTPLQKKLKYLGKWLVTVSVLITFLIVIIGILKGQSIYNMFLAGVSLAVAAIPEGLPAIVTLALALGVQKMIKNNAIVRKLQAVETLGCSTVICSDKTGTLTKNEMTLKSIYINHRIKKFNSELKAGGLNKLLKIGAVCSTVKLREKEKQGTLKKVKEFLMGTSIPDFIGDPTEIALVKAIYEHNLHYSELLDQYEVIDEEPFEPSRKRMSVLVETSNKSRELWIKGAPETIMSCCKYVEFRGKKQLLSQELKKEIKKANNAMASDALRVLALAYRPIKGRISKNGLKEHEHSLIFVGMVGLIDPPRDEAYHAVNQCYQAGIRPIMITGDHKITAQVIAEDLGIIKHRGRVLTGKTIKKIDTGELRKAVSNVNVYARISPEDKLRIVKSLHENGEIVTMTGDGVNDAPAVKEADIGVAMGKKGTDVTKEVSSLILADDNFATIVKAIEEGRKIYNNIRKFIRYLLSCNTGEILAIFMGIVMGLPLPLIPIQILWVNLVTDGLPALALGMDDDSDNVMENNPRDPEESVFAHGMISNIVSQGSLIGISTMAAFLIAIYRMGADLNTARTMAFSTLVFSQLFFVFCCRSEEHSFWELSPFSNMYLVAAVVLSSLMQLAVIYVPVLAGFFKTTPLTSTQWIIVGILSTWSTIILDFIKSILRSRKKGKIT